MPTGDSLAVLSIFIGLASGAAYSASTVSGIKARKLWAVTAFFAAVTLGWFFFSAELPFSASQALPFVTALVPVTTVGLVAALLRAKDVAIADLREELLRVVNKRLDTDMRDRQALIDRAQKALPERQETAAIECRLERVEKYATTLSLIDRLGDVIIEVSRKADRVERLWKDFMDVPGADYTNFVARGTPPLLPTAINAFEHGLAEMETSLNRQLGVAVNLTATPLFSANPHHSFPGSEEVPDPRRRVDYNRLYEKRRTALKALKKLSTELEQRRGGLQRDLSAFAKDEPLTKT